MTRYRIVPERSTVTIDARSNVHPIHTQTSGLEGYVELELGADGAVDLEAKAAAALSLSVSHLQSGNRLEDREMQRRIDARRYPTISGELDRIEPGRGDGSYRVSGTVTFRGVSRPHADEMAIRAVDQRTVSLAGRSRFDVREFGMEPPRVLVLRVEPEVDVAVDIVAVAEG
ncbi:MAG: YceI family protein [Acidimicrobiales bacterium]